MTRPLLGFVAIVKNEASNFARTLESVRPFVERWTVLDTGSTDGTQELVRRTMALKPGALFEEPFVDFATSRNRVLKLDETTSYHATGDQPVFTLMLSGDEVLEDGQALRDFLEAHRDAPDGAYAITMRAGSGTWTYPRVLRTDAGWRYHGRVHEMPVSPEGTTQAALAPGRIVHTVSDPKRRAERIRTFDIPVLTEIVNDEAYTLPERARAMFFLAEAHTAIAAEHDEKQTGGPWLTHQMLAMSLYWRYGQLTEATDSPAHDLPKAIYAYFFYFHIAEKVGFYQWDELLPRVEALTTADPTQPEARFLAAKCGAHVDPRKGLFLAEEAARVAGEAADRPRHLPTDSRIQYMARAIAAECARQLKNTKRMRENAELGIAAGGPREMFEDYLR